MQAEAGKQSAIPLLTWRLGRSICTVSMVVWYERWCSSRGLESAALVGRSCLRLRVGVADLTPKFPLGEPVRP